MWTHREYTSLSLRLDDYMVKAAETTFGEVDAILMLVEPLGKILPEDENVMERLKNVKTPVILVINKIDGFDEEKVLKTTEIFSKAIILRK